jgi:3-hydroxybutyryl-CoA dehydrogenase
MDAAAVQACKDRLQPAASLRDLAGCELVVEAIVERLDVKQGLFAELEGIVAPDAVLATNTSSLSVTAIAAASSIPQRFAGYHFFNPVPLMKVVEVIAGLKTDAPRCAKACRLRPADGPHARAGAGHARLHRQPRRPRLRHRGAAHRQRRRGRLRHHRPHPARPGRLQAGPLRTDGPDRLDVSHPVMESIYRQYYDEAALPPQRHHGAAAGRRVLGRKTGEGFYRYVGRQGAGAGRAAVPRGGRMPPVWVSTRAARRAELLQLLKDLGATVETGQSPRRRP